MTKNTKKDAATLSRTIHAIRRQIAAMDFVAQGTVSKRTKVCGKPNCRCAEDPQARHGPYYEWTRRQNGRYVHTVISAEQAEVLVSAIDNHKRVLALLARWSTETSRALKLSSGRK
jgi:hypothetical protein